MSDLPAAAWAPEWLRGLNAVDLILIAALCAYALDGVRRGFIAGALGLASIAGSVVLAVKGYRPAAGLVQQFATLPPLVANVAGFFAVLLLAQLVFAVASRAILLAVRPVRLLLGPLALVDNALGAIPGLVQGVFIAALVLTPLHLIPISEALTTAIDRSVVAREITQRAGSLTPQLEGLLSQALDEGMIFRARVIEADANIHVSPQTELREDPRSEAEMLALLNAERTKAGLRPLVADEKLQRVARQHSEEMFRLGYFSHTSPRLGTPTDRLRLGGVTYLTSGENLAYAPTVEVAHHGLLASPGHRRNILAREFSRVGIGVVNAGFYGRMFTQNFAG